MDKGTLLTNGNSYSGDGGTLIVNGISYSGGVIENGIDVSDTTADAMDVLYGRYFYNSNGVKTLGQYHPPVVPELKSIDVRVNSLWDGFKHAGQWQGWDTVFYGLAEEEKAKVIPENIKKDVTILGVTGTLEEQSGGYTQFATGSVKCSTSVEANVDVGFRPRLIILIQAGGTTSSPTNYIIYDENVGYKQTMNGSTAIDLPSTAINRMADVTDTGFVMNKVSNINTVGTVIYWAFG